jgi:K+-sensing histidine kinase KdpD
MAYMRKERIASPWETRARIVTCVPPEAGRAWQIELAADYAARRGAQFNILIVATHTRSAVGARLVQEYGELTHQLGGELHLVTGRNVARSIVRYVQDVLATEVILGHRHGWWSPWDTTSNVIRLLSEVDIHVLKAGEGG